VKRLAFAFGVTLVVLLLLSLLSRLSGGGGDEVARESEGHLYYVVEGERSLALRVASGASRVKLVCLLRLPADADPDPAAVHEYGVDVLLLGPDGNELWRKPVWFRSRCSEQGGLTDDRVVELDVSPLLETGGTLRLEVAGESPAPILVRGFRRYLRSFDTVPNTVGHQGEIKRRQRAHRVGLSAWSALEPDERADLHSFKWKPMEAIGSPGRDYSTERVVLWERERSRADDSQLGRLEPGRADAFNLAGPARFQVTGRSLADGGSALLVVVNSAGDVRETPMPLPGAEPREHEVVVEDGEIATLSIFNDGSSPLWARVSTEDLRGRFAGTSARLDEASGRFVLGPDYGSVRLVRLTGAHGTAYRLADAVRGRMRIEARSVGAHPIDVTLALLDDEGDLIGASTLQRPASPTAYEATRATGPGQPWEPSGRAQTAEFWTDPRAHSIRLTATYPVDVRILAPVGDGLEAVSREPYGVEVSGSSLRYEPLHASAWQPLRAEGASVLAVEGRESLVRSQVRLEPTGVTEPHPLGWPLAPAARRQVALLPDGYRARQRLVERWSGGGWPASARTQLVPGETLSLGGGDRETTLEIWVDDDQRLGESVALRCDGEELTQVALQATYLRRQLALPSGCGLSLDGPGGITALLDTPARGGRAQRYRSRTVHRFEHGEPLELDLRLPAGGDGSVLLLAYYELPPGSRWPSQTSRVRVTLTGQPSPGPGEVYRRTTPLVSEHALSPSGGTGLFLADRKGQALIKAVPVRVGIGDDLSGRPLGLRIERLDDGHPLWVRLVGVAIEGEQPGGRNQYVDRPAFDGVFPIDAVSPELGQTLADVVEADLRSPRGPFQPAPEGAMDAVRALGWQLGEIARWGSSAAAEALPVAAGDLGFELRELRPARGSAAAPLLWLCEAPDEGRGSLWLRFASSSPVLLQAPHAFADRGTGQLAAMFMEEGGFHSLQYNTRHRRAVEGDGTPPTDLAHVEESWFQGLTLGLLDGGEPALLVQLHGFSRETVADGAVDVVVSGGLPAVEEVVDAFILELADQAPEVGVARFPDDIDRLGALSNVQGGSIVSYPAAAFLHLELGPELREQLLDSPQLRGAFIRAIEGAARTLERAQEDSQAR